MTTVLVVDDQALVRAGLHTLLTHDDGATGPLVVVDEASDGAAAVELARRHRPDVVLMDVRMPGLDGIEATRRIRADERLAATRVLVLTTFDDDDDVVAAVRAGASGYLLKDTGGPELRAAVRTAADGGNVLSPSIARRVMELLAAAPGPPERDERLDRLTGSELAVLARVGLGETNDEIARVLFLSPATVRTYVSRILAKVDARDRTELALIAHRSGLVRPEQDDR